MQYYNVPKPVAPVDRRFQAQAQRIPDRIHHPADTHHVDNLLDDDLQVVVGGVYLGDRGLAGLLLPVGLAYDHLRDLHPGHHVPEGAGARLHQERVALHCGH